MGRDDLDHVRKDSKKDRKSEAKKKTKRKRSPDYSTSDSDLIYLDEDTAKILLKKLKKLKKKKKRKDKKKKDVKLGVNVNSDKDSSVISKESRKFAPMTKEEWEKQESTLKRVYDENTGRTRLMKGTGEIVEECVSRERQLSINKMATIKDGEYFQKMSRCK